MSAPNSRDPVPSISINLHNTSIEAFHTSMSPSRGLNLFFRAQILNPRQYARPISNWVTNSHFIQKATSPTSRTSTQIYISRSDNPFLNLSIEHFLLENSHADSTILFLYVNRPCVVIGRNQNPWVEVNNGLLKVLPEKVDLVRRRSGGGTVFHDPGNVNWSVICPKSVFDRDRYAQMVVRALKKLGKDFVRVNERHDVVTDPKSWNSEEGPKKVSGSAYKITRLRGLHHGTCLLKSGLESIHDLLTSPAKKYITAKGSDSVRSPVQNVGAAPEDFQKAVVAEFQEMHNTSEEPFYVEERERSNPTIKEGIVELMSKEWKYGQTPEFTFNMTQTDAHSDPVHSFTVNFNVKKMKLQDFSISISGDNIPPTLSEEITQAILASPQRFHAINWSETLLTHVPPEEPPPVTKPKNAEQRMMAALHAATAAYDRSPEAQARAALRFAGAKLDGLFGRGGFWSVTLTEENDNAFQTSEMARVSGEQRMALEKKVDEVNDKLAFEEEEREISEQERIKEGKGAAEWRTWQESIRAERRRERKEIAERERAEKERVEKERAEKERAEKGRAEMAFIVQRDAELEAALYRARSPKRVRVSSIPEQRAAAAAREAKEKSKGLRGLGIFAPSRR
ncbi:putative lipoate-protein ligase A [Lachnellula suecica]|uniref:Putative lipoate-protein ligase A n=1 Tax=Lachnellula suecica TaxID=602035 RepID=A0A8T9CE85_9HELO|nr:putative lipoate-protein ligase A [Lachnellula suecica]